MIKRRKVVIEFDVNEDNEGVKDIQKRLMSNIRNQFRQPIYNDSLTVTDYENQPDENYKKCVDKILLVALNNIKPSGDGFTRYEGLSDNSSHYANTIKGLYDERVKNLRFQMHKRDNKERNIIYTDNDFDITEYYYSNDRYIDIYNDEPILLNLKASGKMIVKTSNQSAQGTLYSLIQKILGLKYIPFTCSYREMENEMIEIKVDKMINPFRFIMNNLKAIGYKNLFNLSQTIISSHYLLLQKSIMSAAFTDEQLEFHKKMNDRGNTLLMEGAEDFSKHLRDIRKSADKNNKERLYVHLKYIFYCISFIKYYKMKKINDESVYAYSPSMYPRSEEQAKKLFEDITSSLGQWSKLNILSYLICLAKDNYTKSVSDAKLLSDNGKITDEINSSMTVFKGFIRNADKTSVKDYYSEILNEALIPMLFKLRFKNTDDLKMQRDYFFNEMSHQFFRDTDIQAALQSDAEILEYLEIIPEDLYAKGEWKDLSLYENIRNMVIYQTILPNVLRSSYYTQSYNQYYMSVMMKIIKSLVLKDSEIRDFEVRKELYYNLKDVIMTCISVYGINDDGYNFIHLMLYDTIRDRNDYDTNELLDDFISSYLDVIEKNAPFISKKSFITARYNIYDAFNRHDDGCRDIRMRIIADQNRYSELLKIVLDSSIKQQNLFWRK